VGSNRCIAPSRPSSTRPASRIARSASNGSRTQWRMTRSLGLGDSVWYCGITSAGSSDAGRAGPEDGSPRPARSASGGAEAACWHHLLPVLRQHVHALVEHRHHVGPGETAFVGGFCPPIVHRPEKAPPSPRREWAGRRRNCALAGASWKRLKGLEPSTFCMASRTGTVGSRRFLPADQAVQGFGSL
jgi:hypothetical protein